MEALRIVFSKLFIKQFRRLRKNEKERVTAAVREYAISHRKPPAHLRYHRLKGNLSGMYSISAGGDLRIHFCVDGDILMICAAVGAHASLY